MAKTSRKRRWVFIVLAHVFVASLAISISCGSNDSTGHGPFYLQVPTPEGSYIDHVSVDFFLDEEVENGVMTGWIIADGCQVWVDLCHDGDCETVFSDLVGPREVMFEVDSEDSWVFENYLDEFELCYKGGEMWQEPMSCQNWDCQNSERNIHVLFESECPATLQTTIDVNYFDERTPFKGPLWACAYL